MEMEMPWRVFLTDGCDHELFQFRLAPVAYLHC
jgi:hypothetical protein